MIFRKFSLFIAKYIAILLCLITVLLTTPWGSQLTLTLLNNINGITLDYQSGALVRNLKLSSFNLQLDKLTINIKDLSTDINFSCSWKKTLCLKSASANYFSLDYSSNDDDTKQTVNPKPTYPTLFKMPFAIEAQRVALKESHLRINNNDISIDEFSSQLLIDKSEFKLLKPQAKKVTWLSDKETTDATDTEQSTATKMNDAFRQLPEIYLPITLVIENLELASLDIGVNSDKHNNCHQNCTIWSSTGNQLSAHWSKTALIISQFKMTSSNFSIHELSADANLQPPYQINTHLQTEVKNIPWWKEAEKTTAKLIIHGSLDDLTFEVISEGNLAVKSQGNVNLVSSELPFNLSLSAIKIPTPFSLSHLGNYSALSLHLVGDLTKQALELTSQISAYGYNNAQVELKAQHDQGQFNIEQLLFSDIDTNSQLDLKGNIGLLSNEFTWQLMAKSTGFSFDNINLHTLEAIKTETSNNQWLAEHLPHSLSGTVKGNIATHGIWSNEAWSVALSDTDILGSINDSAFAIKADTGINHLGRFIPGKLSINVNDSALTLLSSDNNFWDIKGQLAVDNISKWHDELSGDFLSNFSVSGEKDSPNIKLETQLNELSWQDWHSNLLIIKADYLPMKDHQIQLTLDNDQLSWRKENKLYSADNIMLNITGDRTNHHVKAKWLGDFAGGFELSGQLNDSFSHWQSSVDQSALSYQKLKLANNSAFDISVDLADLSTTIETHCWHGKGLGICLPEQAFLGKAGEVFVNLNIDLSAIDQLLLPKDTELISEVDGDIKVKWSTEEPINAKAHFALSSGYLKVTDEFDQYKLSQWSNGQLSFILNEQELSNEIQLNDINKLPLINIHSTIGFVDNSPASNAPITAKIELNQFNLQPFQSILTDVLTLQGKVTSNLSVNGTLNSPLINGDISLDGGKLRLTNNVNTLENISSAIAITNNKATVDGSFYLKEKASKLSGNIAWQDGFTLNIDLVGEELPLVFPPQLLMNVSPKLNFSLMDKSLVISGDINVVDGIYNIEKLPEASVSLSDDVIILDGNGKTNTQKASGFVIKTNIDLNIAPAFEISGQGLHSNLFGQLQITQQDKHPLQMFGRILSKDGIFKAYGQNLKIDKGELSFNGPIDNPYFNLRASRHIRAEDIDVGIQVTGFADALDMQLFSSPTMTMPETLSYLVRGRSLDAGTENSTAAASFLVGFGVTNSAGLFDKIEELPLISNIAVDTEGEGEKTQATVSGYLGNRVYLKYGIGVYEPINELTVRMFILNRFWLEIVSGIEQSTDLYYSFYID